MWLAPAPDPTPTVYMYLDQVSGGGGPWPGLTTFAPFAVALLALGGVVWSSLHASKTTLTAEDRRAAATISAEDKRAAAAIEAEDRRHQHQTQHDEKRWIRDARAAAYFRLLEAASKLTQAHTQHLWFARPRHHGDDAEYEPVNTKGALQTIQMWNTAVDDIDGAVAAIRAIANPTVATLAISLVDKSQDVFDAAEKANKAALADEPTPWDTESVGRDEKKAARTCYTELIEAIREDLGSSYVSLAQISASVDETPDHSAP